MRLRALRCYPALGLALSTMRVAKVLSDQFAAHADDSGLAWPPVEPTDHRELSIQPAFVAGIGIYVFAVSGLSHLGLLSSLSPVLSSAVQHMNVSPEPTSNAVDLDGWLLKDRAGHRHTFGSFSLAVVDRRSEECQGF